jgi:hypothetical protein
LNTFGASAALSSKKTFVFLENLLFKLSIFVQVGFFNDYFIAKLEIKQPAPS